MKLACQEHLVPGQSLAEKLHWLETHGFAGIELWAFSIKDRVPEIKQAFRDSSIRITSLCGGYEGYLFHDDPEQVEQALQGVRTLLSYAGEVGAGGVVTVPAFGLARSPGVLTPHLAATDEQITQFGDILYILSEKAKEHGVQVFAEVINRYESHAFNQIAEVAKAIQVADASHVSLLIDTFHMNIEEASLVQPIEAYQQLIGYVHLSDSTRRVPGRGHIDFAQVIRALAGIGYNGYMTFECFIDRLEDVLEAKTYITRVGS